MPSSGWLWSCVSSLLNAFFMARPAMLETAACAYACLPARACHLSTGASIPCSPWPQETVPIHAWLHPWLPHLGPALEELYPVVRHKLAVALTVRSETAMQAVTARTQGCS